MRNELSLHRDFYQHSCFLLRAHRRNARAHGPHLLLLPVVVSISYEIIKWAGRSDSALARIASAPGKAVQHLTTAEPDDSMLEVAIESLKFVLPEEKARDAW